MSITLLGKRRNSDCAGIVWGMVGMKRVVAESSVARPAIIFPPTQRRSPEFFTLQGSRGMEKRLRTKCDGVFVGMGNE